jgi:hypothetical protein
MCAACTSSNHQRVAHESNPSAQTAKSKPDTQKLSVSLETGLEGKVVSVNGRYVVLSFPVGTLPVLQQQLNAYHRGLKSAELRVSGPQLDDTIVADVLSGKPAVGDLVSTR